MSTALKRPLAEMLAAAEKIVAELSPFCERIEIVCMPKSGRTLVRGELIAA